MFSEKELKLMLMVFTILHTSLLILCWLKSPECIIYLELQKSIIKKKTNTELIHLRGERRGFTSFLYLVGAKSLL